MRFFRGVLICFLNIIVSIIYMSLIILLLNKVPLIKNVINNIYIKKKNSILIILTFIFVLPLAYLLKIINNKIK